MHMPRKKPKLDSDLVGKIQDARAEIAALRGVERLEDFPQ
jgi:hypothetical protein